MFSLMGNCCIKQGKHPSRKLTLAILGLDNAGKTVTSKGLQGETLDTVAPTIGFSSVDFKFDKHEITLYDLGGGKKIRDIWKNYFADVYGILYCVDSSDQERVDECRQVLRALLEHPKVSGKPVLVLANKQDVNGAMDEIDICENLNLEELVNMNKCPCRVETCSAILGQGKKLDKTIRQGMQWLLHSINSSFPQLEERVTKDVAEVRAREAQEKKERAERVRKIKEERQKKESQDRAERGETEKNDSEDEDVSMSNPFKQLDYSELKKKEAKLKEEKKKKKEEIKPQKKKSLEDMRLPPLNRSYQQKTLSSDEDDDDEDNVPYQRSMKSKSSYDRYGHEDNIATQSDLRLSVQYSNPSLRSSQPGGKTSTKYDHRGGDSDKENSDEDVVRSSYPGRLHKETTPRPYAMTPPPSVSPQFRKRTLMLDDGDELRTTPRRAILAPLDPLESVDPAPSKVYKKKKKKKHVKRNQTAPSDEEMSPPDYDEVDEGPKTAARLYASRGHKSALKASRSPRLETLQEPADSEAENFNPFTEKWSLDLPDLASTQTRRSRPNFEYEDIVT